jgi:SAM-dependent methyltransferase
MGHAPPSNAYLNAKDLSRPETYYPLKIMVCEHCWLVQTEDYASPDFLFSSEYAYFSSTSTGWLAHAASYSARVIKEFALGSSSLVIEVAANDGYLLKNFVASAIPCLGIEPTDSTAQVAERLGIPILREFFSEKLGQQLAAKGQQADLIVANNVFAHVPDINDFTRGMKSALKPDGVITLEFPHLMKLLEFTQFDTVYHEHFSYLSLFTVKQILTAAGLRVWHVEELETHGGSLRVYACHAEEKRNTQTSVSEFLNEEAKRGLQTLQPYQGFQEKCNLLKNNLITFLIEQKLKGKTVAAYGAAAKGNTLLNYAGIKSDLLPFVCDAATAKQKKFLPGSHIPILEPAALDQYQPDYVLILPWNLADEVMDQLAHLRFSGTQFVTAVPRLLIR